MTTLLLLVTVVLVGIAAYFIWRIADQLPDLSFRVSEIQRDIAVMSRNAEQAPAPAAPDPAPAQAAEAAPEAALAAAERRPRVRGRAVVLPNGQRRIEYIRDRYYGAGVSRSDIRKEINEMLEEAGQDRIQYQIVFAATKEPADPRNNPSARRGRRPAAEAAPAADEGEVPEASADAPGADAPADTPDTPGESAAPDGPAPDREGV